MSPGTQPRVGCIALLAFTDGAEALLGSDEDGRVIVRPRRARHFLERAPDQHR